MLPEDLPDILEKIATKTRSRLLQYFVKSGRLKQGVLHITAKRYSCMELCQCCFLVLFLFWVSMLINAD